MYTVPETCKVLTREEHQNKLQGTILAEFCRLMWKVEEGSRQADSHNGRKQTHYV
jgi:hypothetical protein